MSNGSLIVVRESNVTGASRFFLYACIYSKSFLRSSGIPRRVCMYVRMCVGYSILLAPPFCARFTFFAFVSDIENADRLMKRFREKQWNVSLAEDSIRRDNSVNILFY